MATFKKRGKYWQAQVRRVGHDHQSRSFDSKGDAEAWARQVENEIDRGIFFDRREAERTTLADAFERYRKEVVPLKLHKSQENQRINRWLDSPLAKRMLANLRGADFAKHRDERRAAGRAENTIRLELAIVGHLFEMARKEWGMEYLQNPLNNIRKPSGSKSRDRRLKHGEFELLQRLLSESSNVYAAPAMVLAIETALRQGMLCNLEWKWVDLDACMIRIPVAFRGIKNKGVPAMLPLSTRAIAALRSLPGSTDGRVLATTQNALVMAFKTAKKRYMAECHAKGVDPTSLLDLRWHDLRHEAASRLSERGFDAIRIAAVTGHRPGSMQMVARYVHTESESLVAMLG